jgi:hypothetical protein
MASGHIAIQAELTHQVWDMVDPVVSRQELEGQSRSNVDLPKPRIDATTDDEDICEIESVYRYSDDEGFGECETVKVSNDDESWVSISSDDFGTMESGVADLTTCADKPTFVGFTDSHSSRSPLPSPLPRGYLRSTQDLEAFLHPMDFASESTALGDLLLFDSSTYSDFTPLVSADAGMTSSARRGTSTESMWSLGMTAFARLASARQALVGNPSRMWLHRQIS